MSRSTTGSIKFALLAYSVYCWVDGSARARQNSSSGSSFNLNSLVTDESESSVDRDTPSAGRLKACWAWIVRRGPPISEEEHSAIGKIDVATAFLLFNAIRRLTSPKRSAPRSIIPAVTLPTPGVPSGLCWKTLILATALLSLLHETRRAAVLYYLRTRHADLTSQIQKDLAHMRIGQVLVRGADVTPASQAPEEEEEECLICSGSAETMSTSSHTGSSSRGLGPLEAFCTNAPDKHLTHRSCFLRWHAAYIQQRPTRHPVSLADNAPMQEAFIRAGIILRAAGFEYLLPRLKQTDEGQRDGDKLEIHRHEQGSDQLLATLRTSAPPCPGCRSPVSLRFIDSRPPSSVPMSLVTPQPRLVLAKFWREWATLVTGRTLTSYFGSLLSFMTVLAAITKARENSSALVVSFLG